MIIVVKGLEMNHEKTNTQIKEKQKKIAEDNGRTCFIVAPIGSEGTDVRRSTEGLLKAVLKPVLERFGYEVVIAHEISVLGSITDQVVNHLLEAELVVADLTGLNPNVMYELAIRHCAALPVIVVASQNTKLPFDVVVERTIFYSNDMYGGVDLSRELEKIINLIYESNGVIDNPVSRAKKAGSVREKLMSDNNVDVDVGKYLMDKMDRLEGVIGGLTSRKNSNNDGVFEFKNKISDYYLTDLKVQASVKELVSLGVDVKKTRITRVAGEDTVEVDVAGSKSDLVMTKLGEVFSKNGINSWLVSFDG